MRKGQPPGALEIVVGALVGVHHDKDGWRWISVCSSGSWALVPVGKVFA
jgi:hypothetical protein